MLNRCIKKVTDFSFRVSALCLLWVTAACDFADYIAPNPDANTLYSEPYLGLSQLNSIEGRRMAPGQVENLRGRLETDARNLAVSRAMVPNAALPIAAPERQLKAPPEEEEFLALNSAQISNLAERQREADVNLGIYREASERAMALAEQQEQVQAQKDEQLRKIQEANKMLSEAKIVSKREVQAVPQPQTPNQLSDLLKVETDDEQFFALVYFSSGSAQLGPREHEIIKAIATAVDPKAWRLIVRGYDSGSLANRTKADRVKSLRLSRSRAEAVKDLLVELGYPGDRVMAQGFGDQGPVFPEVNDVGVFGNQRVQISGIRD